MLALPVVRQLIEGVVVRHQGELSFNGIVKKVAASDWILWLVWDGSVKGLCTSEIYFDIGGVKRCRIPLCTGENAKQWAHLVEIIEDFAKSEGCAIMDMIARKGWAKHLPKYKMTHVVLEKRIA